MRAEGLEPSTRRICVTITGQIYLYFCLVAKFAKRKADWEGNSWPALCFYAGASLSVPRARSGRL
jgi:hypothetical protein